MRSDVLKLSLTVDQLRTISAALACYEAQEMERLLYGPLDLTEWARARGMRRRLQRWLAQYEAGVAARDA